MKPCAFQTTLFGTNFLQNATALTHSSNTPQQFHPVMLPSRRRQRSMPSSYAIDMSMTTNAKHCSRRQALKAAALGATGLLLSSAKVFAEEEYSIYKGPLSLGFTFSYPASWKVKKKPIKTHLSEVIIASEIEPSTTAGLVVDSVKIGAIDEFGTPEAVGEKVVGVEKKKESVNSAFVNSATSLSKGGLLYYVIDYNVDSSRGVKRYLAKATVTGGQLYVFTAQAKTDGFEGETESVLQKMLESFSVAKQYV